MEAGKIISIDYSRLFMIGKGGLLLLGAAVIAVGVITLIQHKKK